jgi:hypothetical protein
VACVALSSDGIRWKRPELGLHGHPAVGSKNNLILPPGEPAAHNFTPMIDARPGIPAQERFKSLGGSMHYKLRGDDYGLWAYASPDGLHWKRIREKPVMGRANWPHSADSLPVPCFWSQRDKCYVAYVRIRAGRKGTPVHAQKRGIGRVTSKDFRTWSKVEPVKCPRGPRGEELNCSTSAVGGVRVEPRDAKGTPLPEFSLHDCDPVIGDSTGRTVSWKGRTDVSAMAGRAVRLRFVMKDADLYSFKFGK